MSQDVHPPPEIVDIVSEEENDSGSDVVDAPVWDMDAADRDLVCGGALL